MMRREAGLDTNWLYAVFHGWARTDLDGALASASKLDDRLSAKAEATDERGVGSIVVNCSPRHETPPPRAGASIIQASPESSGR